jgi:hypothetical protein
MDGQQEDQEDEEDGPRLGHQANGSGQDQASSDIGTVQLLSSTHVASSVREAGRPSGQPIDSLGDFVVALGRFLLTLLSACFWAASTVAKVFVSLWPAVPFLPKQTMTASTGPSLARLAIGTGRAVVSGWVGVEVSRLNCTPDPLHGPLGAFDLPLIERHLMDG